MTYNYCQAHQRVETKQGWTVVSQGELAKIKTEDKCCDFCDNNDQMEEFEQVPKRTMMSFTHNLNLRKLAE